MISRWTRWVVRHRMTVLALWSVVILAGVISGGAVNKHLTTSLAVPGTDSQRAAAILATDFHQNVEGTFTVVVPFRQASSPTIRRYERGIAEAARSIPTAVVTQQRALGGVLYANISTSLNLMSGSTATEALRHALRQHGVALALVTGPPALNHDLTPVLTGDLRRGEVAALVIALLLLLMVLGWCWAVVVPFVVAAATAGAALCVVYLLSLHFLMVLYIPNVVELIGLGLAIDYSLLIVHRFREEVEAPMATVEDAVVRTMESAGRTVVVSGLTVAVGLATLFIVPVPFMRSLGTAGLVVPVVALVSALTLQPALLVLLGRGGITPRALGGLLSDRGRLASAWERLGRYVVRRPRSVLAGALLSLLLASTSALWLQVTPGSVLAVPQSLESARAITLVSVHDGPGVISPIDIVIDAGRAHQVTSAPMRSATLQLAVAISHDPEVVAVAIDSKAPFVDPSGRYEQIVVIGRHDLGSLSTRTLVERLRADYVTRNAFPTGTRVLVGGAPAQGMDFLAALYGSFMWLVIIVALLAYVILVRAFRSLYLAMVALVLDAVSVAAAFGMMVAVFRFGVLSTVVGTYHVDQIEGWVPLFLFAMLFGLSMDYEVFIVTRMRESYDHLRSTPDAIIEGLSHTGGVVSAAAVIFVGALSGMVFGHIAGLQELGVGLAFGVIIDATLVRGLVLPSIMALSGRMNWWLPPVAARLLRTTPAPLRAPASCVEEVGIT